MVRKALEDNSRFGGGMFRRVTQALQSLPGADVVQKQIERVEHVLLSELKSRMDAIEDGMKPQQQGFVVVGAMVETRGGRARSLPQRMARLLEQAEAQSREQAYESLFHQFIGELVPDEARILGALSDGATFPLVHATESFMGRSSRILAENFTTVGRPAMVKLMEQVPAYVAHLRSLGLVDIGAEDKGEDLKYQILENDLATRQVIESITGTKGSPVKFQRRTLRITELGRQFWLACQPETGEVIEGDAIQA